MWWVGGLEKERPEIVLMLVKTTASAEAQESFSSQRFDDVKHRRPLVTVMESYAIWSQSEQINILYTSGIERTMGR